MTKIIIVLLGLLAMGVVVGLIIINRGAKNEEQTTQQIAQKPSLPIKTKVAAWWMVILGGLWFVVGLIINFFLWLNAVEDSFGLFYFIIPGLLLFLPNLFLIKRKKVAWYLSMFIIFFLAMLLLELSLIFGILSLIFLFVLLPPLILLHIDSENFFKIAS